MLAFDYIFFLYFQSENHIQILKKLSMISYDSPRYPWEEHEMSSFSSFGDQEAGSERETTVPKVPWQAYTWAIATPYKLTRCYSAAHHMPLALNLCKYHLEEWHLHTNSHWALKWGNFANLAYLAIINGRCDRGKRTDIDQCEFPHLAERTRQFHFFFFFNLDTSVLVCPENEMNDSYWILSLLRAWHGKISII